MHKPHYLRVGHMRFLGNQSQADALIEQSLEDDIQDI